MKPILVPVDFSKPAEHAARYAVQLSKIMKSNMVLCHAFLAPTEAVGSAQIAWPLVEYATLDEMYKAQLNDLLSKLEIYHQAISGADSFHPVILCAAEMGNTIEVIKHLAADKKAGLIVMGMSGAGAVSRFFMGSVSRQLLEKARCPVLLIPKNYTFKPVKKIGFATDLNEGDIKVINSFVDLAEILGADLVICHVTDHLHDTVLHNKESEEFIIEVRNKINYDSIYFRHIESYDIDEGLEWLTREGHIDMLAMVHHQKGLWGRIFDSSHTKKIVGHIPLPLLVFPAGVHFTF